MYQLDNTFLDEIGLGAMPEEQKAPFLQHVYEQLEYRVGIRLSEGLTDAQLDEFEGIIDRHEDSVNLWLQNFVPQYQSDPLYAKLQASLGLQMNDPNLAAEYAATKWLEVNRPDYRDVVARTLNELKQEISQSRDSILGIR